MSGVNAAERDTAAPTLVTLHPATWPWWAKVSGIYLAARLFTFIVFYATALKQGPNPWLPASPGYWDYITIWDGRWYQRIAESGYPSQLPMDAAGNVQENTWAFMPLFPLLSKFIAQLTGLSLMGAMSCVAMVAGLGAALVIYRLFAQIAGPDAALWGTAFVATFPVSAILQVPYAESLNLLLLATTFLWVLRRRYLLALPFAMLACYSRPVGVPLGAALGIFFVLVLVQAVRARRRSGVPLPASLASLGTLAVVTCLTAVSWPVLAGVVTGVPDAYTATETVWRGGNFVPFKPWPDMATGLLGPFWGPLALLGFVAMFFGVLIFAEPVRRLGPELRLFVGAYMVYLFAFLYPQTSTFRMLLPLFPLALAAALASGSRAFRGTVILMFSLLQIVWIAWLWDWTQLPTGGDYPP